MIHKNVSFETRRPKIIKNYEKFKKYATINTGCDIKKQHSQSEVITISIYQLSQSGIMLIKLLKLENTRTLHGLAHTTIFALLCSICVKRVSYQPRLFLSSAIPLAVLQACRLAESQLWMSMLFTYHQKHHFYNQWTRG
jgi:hypothetical protein